MVAFLFTAVYVLSTTKVHDSDHEEKQNFNNKKNKNDLTDAFKDTVRSIIHGKKTRHIFLLTFYMSVVLANTLVNRIIWRHPLSSLLGGWGFFYIIHDSNGWSVARGSFDVKAAENIVMLMPEVWLAILTFPEWFRKKGYLAGSIIVAGGTSLIIETLQLVLLMGTFQISDLVYNTLGGVAAGAIVGAFSYIAKIMKK